MNKPTNPETLLDVHPTPQIRDAFDEVLNQLRFVNPRKAEFMKLSRRVCLIRRERGADSTGFLVGPDLLLTSAHALLGTSSVFANPADVTVLFDRFKWNVKTAREAAGDSCGLRIIPFSKSED